MSELHDRAIMRAARDWCDDDGDVLWWRLPVEEPPWVGSPLDDDWVDGYYTHWQVIDEPIEVAP